MGLTPVEVKYEICPEGTFQAVCNGIFDLGLQKSDFNGKTKVQWKILVRWEIDEVMQEGKFKGKRFNISKTYTLSFHEKAGLRKDLKSWRGADLTPEETKTLDMYSMIGKNCLIGIVHTHKGDRTYANISTIAKPMANMTPLRAENENAEPPQWVKDIQEKAVQPETVEEVYGQTEKQAVIQDDDGIPF